ncbi:DNA-directed RNA polymerase subunit beta [Nocardia callitridis]|uniref:DNA-directed RNA polymerase subunit beta n=1 Tax=Nocardia callitridis TaxID=648753 RepID=A0ABP9L2Y8_9NOCA
MEYPAFANTSVSQCAFYRRTCGLPACVDPTADRIILKAGVVGAITMPDRFGQFVRDDMRFRGAALGPVIAHIRSRRWTFLCRPDLPTDIHLFAELMRLDICVAPFGADIALPSPSDARTPRRAWVIPPRDTFRPSGAVLLAAVRARTTRKNCR